MHRLERAARLARVGSRLTPYADDATAAIVTAARRAEAIDAVVVNPPRRGLSPELREALADLSPELVAYVSCDPETLARDLSHLARAGLATRRAQPFDMLPLTGHVETLVFLSRTRPTPPRVLFESESLVAVEKPAHEPTTPQGEHTRSLLARVRLLPDMAEAVPVHRLDAGTSGVCLFARRPSLVAPLAAALAAGEKRYVALVRGIIRPKGTIARALKDEGRTLEATTRYTRKKIVGGHSLVEARPAEGRTHQIRRHLASLDHAVLGDERYGHPPSNKHFAEKHALDRTFLHCARITLTIDGAEQIIASELPGDLELVLSRLGR
jgi:23S rRNA (uracil1939-C5)-methyltransferase